jgi:hypothetical protein
VVRTLYRIVHGSALTREDVQSNLNKCRHPIGPEIITPSIWAGISTWDTRQAAARTARRYRRIGAFIAEMRIPDDPRLLIQPSLAEGHFTLLGCEDALLSCDARVEPILD